MPRFTFNDAKAKIKELEDTVKSLNVDLSDNIITADELRVLKAYKVGFFVAAAILIVGAVVLIF